VFLYQPGCNGSALYRGNVDGSGVAEVRGFTPTSTCTARDPKGGFYIVIDDCPECITRTYHLPTARPTGQRPRSSKRRPRLLLQRQHRTTSWPSTFCSMAAASDGSIFIQTFQDWGEPD